MIETITIAGVASYPASNPSQLKDLRPVNYIFGSNGTGKSTIGRVISHPPDKTSCSCDWQNEPLERIVLNQDFIDKNFDQLRGVFTLGEQQNNIETKIGAANNEIDKERDRLATFRTTLGEDAKPSGKKEELNQLEEHFQEKCWAQKQKHDAMFKDAFTGCRASASTFKQRVLKEAESNRAKSHSLDDLKKRAATIFGEEPTKERELPTLDPAQLLAHESAAILSKRVIGREDVDIAPMIKKLGNEGWFEQGLPFYEANDQVCPFCQRPTTKEFAKSLAEYFDEIHKRGKDDINKLVSQYAADAKAIQSVIHDILDAPGRFIDVEELKSKTAALDQIIASNKAHLEKKQKDPSTIVTLQSAAPCLQSVAEIITHANTEAAAHNRTVDNLSSERKVLAAEVWRFILDELGIDLKQYRQDKETIQKAIVGINQRISDANARIAIKEREIRELEKQTTSIQPAITAINHTLNQFGFDSFKLTAADDGKHYRLVRHNGEDAQQTLSEGEKTFVVFLYFYHLLRGSFSSTGIATDRVVVFDDPVSSLDSDVLFIVSNLIRDVCDNARTGSGRIKQVFVMTHNVYFHKEVTYNSTRPNGGLLADESFWIVRKNGSHSTTERYDRNPVRTSYELLWMEVREMQEALRSGSSANQLIENTLRRILEHYFTILGSINRDDICDKFEGQDKIICKSLFSWVNAGSHSALDDVHITPSDGMPQNYLRVFESIFEKTGHGAHYAMMMPQ